MNFDENKLRKKGWTDEEIDHVKNTVQNSNHKKHPTHKHLENAMYWILFVIIIAIGIGGVFMIQPFLLYLNPKGAYILISVIGLVFGTFAGIVVKDIDELEKHHHLAINIIIPVTAIISSIIVSKQVQIAADKLGKIVELHPITLGIIFSISILIPYSIFIWYEERKRK